MKITVDGIKLNLQEGDEVEINRHDCGRCDTEHTELIVYRGKIAIARVGDDVRLHGNDEQYGGVVLDEEGNPKAEHQWVTHIIPNDKSGMTEDRYHYIGMCGTILTQEHPIKLDRITFTAYAPFKKTDRICPECKKVWEARKKNAHDN